ncbi:hypothetical protein GPK80_13350 [Coprococcus comes]|nr:hypothetical protein [Coprococcus comes]
MQMNEPKLRFSEFKDIWNNHKIEDMFDRVGTPVDLDDTLTYREIGIRSHGKGIFHKDETTASEIGNKRVFWVEPDCFVVNIVFAWERAVAKTTEAENGMIASHRFPMYKPKKDVVDLDYITEYFITKRGQNVLILASPGGAGRNKTLGQKEFAKSVVKLPSLPEQQKIAEFLSTIDTVIEKQKETVSAWEERKKGVMQKLFSQEVRFKADDGSDFPEWEEKPYLSICNVFTDGDWIESKDQSDSGIRLIQTGNIGNGIFVDKGDKKKYISKETFDRLKCNEVFEGDILISRLPSPAGRACIVPKLNERMITAVDCTIVRTDKSIISHDYCAQFMQSSKHFYYVASMMAGGTRQRISRRNLEDELISVPCLAEQQKIADCLSSLDEVIKKQKATLAAWEELKKGLLQQMFV